MRQIFFIFFVLTAIFSGTTFSAEPENNYPINFKRYSESIASAGQLHDRHIPFIENEDYSLVVYLAYDSSEDKSRLGIDKLIRGTGARYVQLPVDWFQPTAEDFNHFVGAVGANNERNILVHCQMNYRASAFSFLYRVIQGDEDFEKAKKDMLSVWTPDNTWTSFINEVLMLSGATERI
tara:strand:+ start:329 stop:865 length:537 start_codon:yes stop_codon:yes gene_type:complete